MSAHTPGDEGTSTALEFRIVERPMPSRPLCHCCWAEDGDSCICDGDCPICTDTDEPCSCCQARASKRGA